MKRYVIEATLNANRLLRLSVQGSLKENVALLSLELDMRLVAPSVQFPTG